MIGTVRIALLDFAVRTTPRLPRPLLVVAAELVGEIRYRVRPALRAQVRANLRRVVEWLVEHEPNAPIPDRVRRSATDPAALERLVRSAFRHHARTYLELLLAPTLTDAELDRRLTLAGEAEVREVIRPGRRVILVGLHLGPIELPGFLVARWSRTQVVAPMETLPDAALQAWTERTRAAIGLRIIGLQDARRELRAALGRGEPVGIVGDRDVTGGGMPVALFGAPAPLPIGPALLAVETETPVFVGAIWRAGRSHYRGALLPLEAPPADSATRRERLLALLHAEARAIERLVAVAPDQWWSVFFPIWPDLQSHLAQEDLAA